MVDKLSDTVGLTPVSTDLHGTSLDVVFIHGLGGGSHTTWASEGATSSFWPAWIDDEFPEVFVRVLGYETSVSTWKKESLPLPDLGIQVLEELAAEGIGERPLILITHSMGGLVAKQILAQARAQGVQRYESIASATIGVSFFSTPHSGSNLANFAVFASAVLRTSEQVEDLSKHDARLRDLHGAFLGFVNERKPICRSYAERLRVRPDLKILGTQLRLPRGLLVVDATCAEPYLPGVRAIPLDKDHIDIVKPTQRTSRVFRYTRSFLKECVVMASSRSASSFSAGEGSPRANKSEIEGQPEEDPRVDQREVAARVSLLESPDQIETEARRGVLPTTGIFRHSALSAAGFLEEADATDSTAVAALGADRPFCFVWLPHVKYLKWGPLNVHSPIAAISTPDPQATIARLVDSMTPVSRQLLRTIPPRKLRQAEKRQILASIGPALDECLVLAVVFPEILFAPAKARPLLAYQSVVDLFVTPILEQHRRAGGRHIAIKLAHVSEVDAKIIKYVKKSAGAVFCGSRSYTVETEGHDMWWSDLISIARLIAWAVQCFYNSNNRIWLDLLEKSFLGETSLRLPLEGEAQG